LFSRVFFLLLLILFFSRFFLAFCSDWSLVFSAPSYNGTFLINPVPGVGPLTVAYVVSNTIACVERVVKGEKWNVHLLPLKLLR
jgi:hypothetical protein